MLLICPRYKNCPLLLMRSCGHEKYHDKKISGAAHCDTVCPLGNCKCESLRKVKLKQIENDL